MRTDAPRPRRKAWNGVLSRRANKRRSPKKRSGSSARPCRRRRTGGSPGSAPSDSFVSSFPTPNTGSSSVKSAPPTGAPWPRPPACRTPKVGRCWTRLRRCAGSWRMSLPRRNARSHLRPMSNRHLPSRTRRPSATPGEPPKTTAAPGFEAALAAVLGPLVDATAALDEEAAWRAISGAERQTTAVFPVESPPPRAGSLYEHVHVREGYEIIVRRLLGGVVVGREVTRDGVFRASGMLRAGADPRTALDARKVEMQEEIRTHEQDAADASDATRVV